MFLDELHDLKDRYPTRFQLLHVLSREQQEVELLSGRLDGDRLRRILDALLPPEGVDAWFLCGPSRWSSTCARRCSTTGSRPHGAHRALPRRPGRRGHRSPRSSGRRRGRGRT